MIKMSAKYGQYPYREYSGDTGLTQLIQMKPENAIIFICGYDISDEIKLLAYHNDIIYLDLTHPFESNPNESVLFS